MNQNNVALSSSGTTTTSDMNKVLTTSNAVGSRRSYGDAFAGDNIFANTGRGGIRSPVLTQGAVVMNTHADVADMKNRTNIQAMKMSSVIPSTDINQHHISVGQPVFCWESNLRRRVSPNPPVFGSFNGIDFANKYPTSFDLRRAMKFMGVALTKVDVDMTSTHANAQLGLAVQRAGSITMINTGKNALNPGDWVVFDVPYYDVNRNDVPTSEDWYKHNRADLSGRVVAQVRKFDVRDVDDMLRQLYYRSSSVIMKNPVSYLPLFRHFDSKQGRIKNIAVMDRFALSAVNDIMSKFIAGVRAMSARGILQIMTPQKMTKQKIMEKMSDEVVKGEITEDKLREYQRLLKQCDEDSVRTDATRATNMYFTDSRSTDMFSVETSSFATLRQLDKKKRKEMDNELLWLAMRCGFVGVDGSAFVGSRQRIANATFINDIMHCFFCDYIPRENPQTREVREAYMPNFDGMDHYSVTGTTSMSQLDRAIREGAFHSQQYISEFQTLLMEQVSGVVLRGAQSRGEIDVLLTGTFKA